MTDVTNPRKAAPDSVAAQLIEQARAEGVSLVGPGSPLAALTKQVLETALEAELDEHLGYDHGDRGAKTEAGQGNERNGTRAKTVLTELGPVEIEVPRDRDGSFDPVVVRKRQRRLSGVDEMVLSLSAKGLTTGEIAGFFADTYGQELSKDTISRITDKVIAEMVEWANRPLDAGRFLSVVVNRWLEPSSHELGWGAVVEDEAGPVVEFVGDLGKAFVADLVQVGALGEVLA